MSRSINPNLDILERTIVQLGGLTDRLVFLGGCAIGLLITDVGSPPVRMTHDVDVITEAATLAEYYRLSELLRVHGFQEDSSEGAPICRWRAGNIILDVMPTNPELLGFGSRWYQEALEAAAIQALPSGKRIHMITAPFFLACKFAAFEGRGNGDYLMSHDIEDIVALVDGRPELRGEIQSSPQELRNHLAERFQALLADPGFREVLPGLLPGDAASQARRPIILERMGKIAVIGTS